MGVCYDPAKGDFVYSCCFDFMTEFDQWFEWKKREHFDHERTETILNKMIAAEFNKEFGPALN